MALTLEGVSKTVGGRVHIHPTDLTLDRGTMNVLLGPTLAGKTSLMRLMAGLDVPSSGRVLWEGADVTGRRVQDRGVAMVYQQFINYPAMTVFENIASPLRLQGRPKDEIRRRVGEVAEMMKLTPMLDRRPLELSGGQQQRCALARALVKDAGLVLLDEPLANLDYKLREELRIEIPRIFEASGAMNFLPIEKTGERLAFGDGQGVAAEGALARLPDGRYLAGFRPNHLELERHAADALAFTTHLAVAEITGSETFVHLDHQGERWVGLVHGVRELTIGAPLRVHLDPAHVYVFAEDGALVAPAAYASAA